MAALQILDSDMPQYIHDNTDDEKSHFGFINSYLEAIGANPVNLDQFANLPSSKATGAADIGRLTNLMNLNVDTSFWTRYRSDSHNPDLDPNFTFGQAEKIVNRTAIPRTDDDLTGPARIAPFDVPDHLKAIAFTAGFPFLHHRARRQQPLPQRWLRGYIQCGSLANPSQHRPPLETAHFPDLA